MQVTSFWSFRKHLWLTLHFLQTLQQCYQQIKTVLYFTVFAFFDMQLKTCYLHNRGKTLQCNFTSLKLTQHMHSRYGLTCTIQPINLCIQRSKSIAKKWTCLHRAVTFLHFPCNIYYIKFLYFTWLFSWKIQKMNWTCSI